SRLTLMPRALVSRVAFRASSIVVPATNRPETRCPIEELSAMCRKERFSERAMNAALSIGLLKVGFLCVWANSWFYHMLFAAVIPGDNIQIARKSPIERRGSRSTFFLLAVDQHDKRIWNHLRPWPRLLSGCFGCFLEVSRDSDQVVSLFVYGHCTSTWFGGNCCGYFEVSRRTLFYHCDIAALPVGAIRLFEPLIESRGVCTFANSHSLDEFSAVAVEHCHCLVLARGKEQFVIRINRETAGGFAWFEGPVVQDFESFSIDLRGLGFVCEIDENCAFAVRDREFGLATEVDGCCNAIVFRLDDSCVAAAAIEGEYALGSRIKENGVRVCACLHFAGRLERAEVEHNY